MSRQVRKKYFSGKKSSVSFPRKVLGAVGNFLLPDRPEHRKNAFSCNGKKRNTRPRIFFSLTEKLSHHLKIKCFSDSGKWRRHRIFFRSLLRFFSVALMAKTFAKSKLCDRVVKGVHFNCQRLWIDSGRDSFNKKGSIVKEKVNERCTIELA